MRLEMISIVVVVERWSYSPSYLLRSDMNRHQEATQLIGCSEYVSHATKGDACFNVPLVDAHEATDEGLDMKDLLGAQLQSMLL